MTQSCRHAALSCWLCVSLCAATAMSCKRAPDASNPTPSTTSSVAPPSAAHSALLRRLHVSYFPRPPGLPASLADAKLIELPGDGCTPDLTACGVLVDGDAADIIEHPVVCPFTPTLRKTSGAGPIVARWHASLAKHGDAEVGPPFEVAKLSLDGDDVLDRILWIGVEAAPTPENSDGYGPAKCAGLLLEINGKLVPVSDDPCGAKPRVETFAQAFRMKGLPGVVLHVRTTTTSANGGFLVHVDNGRVSVVPGSECSGNG